MPPKAGEILCEDYRPKRYRQGLEIDAVLSPPPPLTLKCIQWNIERGYKLDQVIQVLRSHHADIICLQELDIDCDRSDRRNCAREIAAALRLNCVMYVEFEELRSPLRTKSSQGGGIHGNAILSRWPMDARLVRHRYHPVNWNRMGKLFREPRRGERAVLAADIHIPGLPHPLLCYCLHFEVFCGIVGRLRHFADVLEDCRQHVTSRPYQLVFGDLNTLAHGIARFAPFHCQDWLRFGSIGLSEAAWWQENILSVTSAACSCSGKPMPPGNSATTKQQSNGINPRLKPLVPRSIPVEDAKRLVNPYLFDPFSIHKDTTLQNYWGIFQGKLDWTFLRGFRVLGKGMDNRDYSASDHKLLYVIVRPVLAEDLVQADGSDDEGLERDGVEVELDVGRIAYEENFDPDRVSRSRDILFRLGLFFGTVLAFKAIFRYLDAPF